MGRRKKKEIVQAKRLPDEYYGQFPWMYPDPLADSSDKRMKLPVWDVSISSNCKMWRTASRRCSKTYQYPSWLGLPHDHQHSCASDVVKELWDRYCWRFQTYPYQSRKCCPEGKEFCKHSHLNWTEEEHNLEDPNSFHATRSIEFTNAIVFKDKFYALSLQGTLASVDLEAHPRVTILKIGRAIPSTPFKGFREYLIEFTGDLLVVFLISKKSMNTVDDIEVYKLDLLGSTWKRIKTLGDHALFVTKHRCMDACPRELGCNREWNCITDAGKSEEWWSKGGCSRNCIYFTLGFTDDWREFHMEDGSILPSGNVTEGFLRNHYSRRWCVVYKNKK